MADRVFCIDFGSSYTKVALRRDPGADGEVVRSISYTPDEPDFCFPSAVGVERRDGKNVAVFGADALAIKPGGRGVLHTDWKKRVFAPVDPDRPPDKPPLEALLDSPELTAAARQYAVTDGQLVLLRNLLANARALAGGPAAPTARGDRNRTVASSVAPPYFRWLREQVIEGCRRRKLDGLDPDAIPARLLVPAFAPADQLDRHPGCQLLVQALKAAGWRMHADRPVVAEPFANAIGVLTGGSSVVVSGKAAIGRMFGRAPLMTALRAKSADSTYRAVVIDVGAFTTDFAAVTMQAGATVAEPDLFTTLQHSARIGVSDLDARIVECLPEAKRNWLGNNAEPLQRLTFRRSVYHEGRPLRTVEVGVIGGPADAELIRPAIDAFVQAMAAEADKFLAGLEPMNLQELILTGGGVNIPRLRDGLIGTARGNGRDFIRTYAPGLPRTTAKPYTFPLSEDLTRGGSALGGASIYFEKEYN